MGDPRTPANNGVRKEDKESSRVHQLSSAACDQVWQVLAGLQVHPQDSPRWPSQAYNIINWFFFLIKSQSFSILRQVFLINVYSIRFTETSGTKICQNFCLNNHYLFKFSKFKVKLLTFIKSFSFKITESKFPSH